MFKGIIIAAAVSVIGASALACHPQAQGLTAEQLGPQLSQITKMIESRNVGQFTAINVVNWEDVSIETGAEGDCHAVRVTATVNLQAKKGSEDCIQTLEIVYSQSTLEVAPYLKQTEESLYCF